MLIKIITGGVAGGLALGVVSVASAAAAPANDTRVVAAQPGDPSGGAQPPAAEGVPPATGEALPPPARPAPARKRSFFAGPGLGLLALGAGAGAGAAVASSDDGNPASP